MPRTLGMWSSFFPTEGTGGGYIHSGVLVLLDGSTFVGNQAGEDGPAVMSLGIAENFSSVTFDANTFYCSAGAYGYENETEAGVGEDEHHTDTDGRLRGRRYTSIQNSFFCIEMTIFEKTQHFADNRFVHA